MRLSVYVYLFIALTPAAAFVVGPAARLPLQSRSTHLFSTSDEEKLDKMAQKWKDLQKVEKEVEKSADEVRLHDGVVCAADGLPGCGFAALFSAVSPVRMT